MDRALSDRIEASGIRGRGGRGRRQNDSSRNGARKWNERDDKTSIEVDWLHDKYEDDPESRRPIRGRRNARVIDRYSPEPDIAPAGAKLRVDNLHYDLTEDDLQDLFTRIGPVSTLSLRFDRAGRSSGTAYVTYTTIADARTAIRDFDGANANGQPIRLTLLPTGPSAQNPTIDGNRTQGRGAPAVRNPFDTAVKPGRSLFDRIEAPRSRVRSRTRSRSRSPGKPRRTDTRGPAPEGVDRYVPGGNGRRSRSRSLRRKGDGRGDGRARGRREERETVGGRPRKTQEELDKEMEDYWGKREKETNGRAEQEVGVLTGDDGDVDMGV